MSDRDCSYPSKEGAVNRNASASSSRDTSSFSTQETATPINHAAPLTPASSTVSQGFPLNNGHHNLSNNDVINFDHMELLVHITQDTDIWRFNVETGGLENHSSGLALGLQTALKAPYLMCEILAFAAQHLATIHPEKSAHYLHQAVSLQTRAISVFNETWAGVDESNCVAVLLFSSVLGHHLLADTFLNQDPSGLDAFIAHYVQCVEIHRGIYTIAGSAWPLLMNSKLEPVLTRSAEFMSRQPIGHECNAVRDLIDRSEALSQVEKDACQKVLRYLQVGLDATAATHGGTTNRRQMMISMTMLVSPEMTALLTDKQPEALVLLAYYAVLLHYGRDLWQVKGAGTFVFNLIDGYLGAEWGPWLQYPREVIIGP